MKHVQVKLVRQVDAHNRFEATAVIVNPYKNGQIISIAHDGFIRTWRANYLSVSGTYRIISPYLMTIVPFEGKFLLGIGNGNLVQLSQNFQIQKQYQIHEDCLTTIVILQKYIVTGSYDGNLHFLNKLNFNVEKTIQLNAPINQCLFYRDFLYVASNPSYKINVQTFEKTQIERYKQFMTHKDKLFGRSDQNGVTCLDDKFNVLVPCQFMLSHEQYILICSDRGIGVLFYDEDHKGQWHLNTITEFQAGMSILSGVFYKNKLFITGQSSQIYQIQMCIWEKKYPQQQEQNLVMISS